MIPRAISHLCSGAALALVVLLTGCPDEKDLLRRRRGTAEERARRRAGRGVSTEPDLLGMPRPLGGGAVARILVQPLEEKLRRGAFTWALVVAKPEVVKRVRQALLAAPAASFRTCPPTWRVDLRYGHDEHVVRLNLPCRRLVLDGQERVYDAAVQKALGPLLRLAVRKPSHKIFGVRVPAQHDPRKVLPVLSARQAEAFLPERPARRGPVVRMAYAVLERSPGDPRQLDQAVVGLRQRAYARLEGYAKQLKVGRHEILDVVGPEPVFERFSDRVLEARYVVTVLFRYGTPEYLLGFLGLGNNFVVEKVTVPKDYRVDLIVPADTKVTQIRKILSWATLKPPLARW